jgi:hypothetical protein
MDLLSFVEIISGIIDDVQRTTALNFKYNIQQHNSGARQCRNVES